MSRWRSPGRRFSGAALIGALILPLPSLACREKPAVQPTPRTLRIGTAFGPLTEPLAKEYRRTLPNTDVQTVSAPNSGDVISAIAGGTADFGVAFTHDTYAGYWNQMARTDAKKREI